ncbi:MAG: RDD family protein [Ginsengibacter sp.]
MSLIKIATIFNIDLEFEIAELYKRILAYLVDLTILVIFFISMKNFYYGGVSYDSAYLEGHIGLDILTISLPMLLYAPVSEILMNGQTAGKKVFNIRIISLDGGEPSVVQYLIRWIFKVFEWPFFFGYIFYSGEALVSYIFTTLMLGAFVVFIIAITKKNQRLGDFAANTVVVNTKSPYSVNDTVFMNIADDNYIVTYPDVLMLSDRDITIIKNVMNQWKKEHNHETLDRVSVKVKKVLKIENEEKSIIFLNTLLKDYNFLAGN